MVSVVGDVDERPIASRTTRLPVSFVHTWTGRGRLEPGGGREVAEGHQRVQRIVGAQDPEPANPCRRSGPRKLSSIPWILKRSVALHSAAVTDPIPSRRPQIDEALHIFRQMRADK